MLRSRGPLAIAAAGVLLVAGCGEKRDTTTGSASSGGGSAVVNVSETEFKLTPASAKVANAGSVRFEVKNAGATTHALAIETSTGVVKTAPIAPGKSATLTADLKAGTYTWFCPIDGHRAMGMKGQIVVAGGGPNKGGGGGSSGGTPGGYSRGGGY